MITDLATGDDVKVTDANAKATANDVSNFAADSGTTNSGTFILNAASGASTINMTDAGAGTYDIRGGSSGDALTGSAQVDTLTGNGGDDTLQGKGGSDTMTGGAGADTFKVDVGSDIITDLGGSSGGDSDVLIVSSGATANATNIVSFTAGGGSSNSSGTVNLTTQTGGGTINMNAASGDYNICLLYTSPSPRDS